ncbi:MAG TPA: MBL fold metallo-hydrolase [Actinomycetota bacterium]|nr:MBL fold metallo-hydrolase [Actinomycetota bacterium]
MNAYVLTGAQTTLVDAGIHDPARGPEESWSTLRKAVEMCDVDPHAIERLIVTHPHADHYGMAARFVDETGAELWMHADVGRELSSYEDPTARAARLRDALGKGSAEELDGLVSGDDWRPYISGIAQPSHRVRDQDRFVAGEREWTVIHTPGHSRSHVCLWSETDAVLVSGDHLLGSITPHVDAGPEPEDPLGDYMTSLERVEKLAARLVLPGHGRPFEGGAERARATLRHHDRRLGAIVQVVRHRPRALDEIAGEIFGADLSESERRLALGEVLAHLDYLERRGEVDRFRRDDEKLAWRKLHRGAGR